MSSTAALKLRESPSEPALLDTYVQLTRTIERLHRRHLDMLRFELDRLGIDGVSAVQMLMLTKIKEQSVSVRDLVERGYYLGSSASYNLKQLADSGLIEQERAPHDRRSIRVKLSAKGKALCASIAEAEERHARTVAAAGDQQALSAACQALKRLEAVWGDYIRAGS
jgi:DNA-binding MarR family transcriptional regulator